MAPPRITGYTIDSLLGRGGFASVYLATREQTGERVALKVLYEHTTDDADIKRFERERMSLAALTGHPHIVDIVDFGETADGAHYIALEYVEGGSIADRLRVSGAMHWADAARVGVHICSALDAAHRAGVLHRDIKPANILYGPLGAKLGDFGIARLVGQSQLTAAQSIIGTLAYTPPEVLHNRAFDGRGDIYQLGITMYEMLLGRAPFKSGSSDNKAIVIRRILDNPAPPLAQFDVPAPISDLLDVVLAKDPADRPQSAEAFATAINEAERALDQPPTRIGLDTQTISRASVVAADGRRSPSFADPTPGPPAPAPPEISEPISDRTVADNEQRGATSSYAGGSPRDVDETRSPSHRQETPPRRLAPERSTNSTSAPSPPATQPPIAVHPPGEPPHRRTGAIIGTIAVLVLAVVGGIAAIQLFGDDPGDDDGAPGTTTPATSTTEPELPVKRTIERVDQPAFAAPGAPQGVIYNAVANGLGLTAVGATASEGFDDVSAQRSAIWTMDVDEEWTFRSAFPTVDGASIDQQRLTGIGLIEGEQFLVVGESAGADGVAWLDTLVDNMVPLTHETFTGPGRQGLFSAAGDPGSAEPGDGEFLVAGMHSTGGPPTPALWIVRPDPDADNPWEAPSWVLVPIRGEREGRLTDVAIAGDNAVAVGWEDADAGGSQGLVMIRREEDTWVNLLEPLPGVRLSAVDFFGDRIIAVGTRTSGGISRPVAVVVNTTGIGLIHELPMAGGRSGQVNDVVETAAGVFAVGSTGEEDGEAALRNRLTDGALWQFDPGTNGVAEGWTTRDTDALGEPGFQEFRAVVEYKGRVFALGRTDTENDGETVAAVWTVTVDADPTSTDVGTTDAFVDALEGIEVDAGGCATAAIDDVRASSGDDAVTLAPVFQGLTDRFAVWICREPDDPGSPLWYHGVSRQDPERSTTVPAEQTEDGEGFIAVNVVGSDTNEYRIADGRLTVSINGQTELDQPLLDP